MPNVYVVLFSGGLNDYANFARYRRDLVRLGGAVLRLKNTDLSRVSVLHGPGGDDFQFPGHSTTVRSVVASRKNLQAELTRLATGATPADRVFFIASNHGGQDEEKRRSTLWCWNNEAVLDDELAEWCRPWSTSAQCFVLGQCYSGGFIRPLARPGRCILTASAWDEPSYAAPDGIYDEFLMRVSEAFEARTTTLGAVFRYARAADTQPERPQFYSGGIGDSPEILDWR